MDPNIVDMNLRNFLNHGASYTRLSVPRSLRATGLWREPFKPLTKTYENVEKMIVAHM